MTSEKRLETIERIVRKLKGSKCMTKVYLILATTTDAELPKLEEGLNKGIYNSFKNKFI